MPNELVKQISYILYKADEEDVKVKALLKDESIWLTQKSMAELFECSPDNIGPHFEVRCEYWNSLRQASTNSLNSESTIFLKEMAKFQETKQKVVSRCRS